MKASDIDDGNDGSISGLLISAYMPVAVVASFSDLVGIETAKEMMKNRNINNVTVAPTSDSIPEEDDDDDAMVSNDTATDDGDTGTSKIIWNQIVDDMNMVLLDDPSNLDVQVKLCDTISIRKRKDLVGSSTQFLPSNNNYCNMLDLISNYDKYNIDQLKFKVNFLLQMTLPPRLKDQYKSTKFTAYQIIRQRLDKILSTKANGAYIYHITPQVSTPIRDDKTKPNFLLLLADDLGYGDVGYQSCKNPSTEQPCTSSLLTPNIDTLSRSPYSITFSRFYAHAQCTPSRAAIITGLEPTRNCMVTNPYSALADEPVNLPPNSKTFSKAAQRLGYRTFFAGKWHLGKIKVPSKNDQSSTPGEGGFSEWYATKKSCATLNPNCGCFANESCDVGMYNASYFLEEYASVNNVAPGKYVVPPKNDKLRCDPYYYDTDGSFKAYIPKQGVWEKKVGETSDFILSRFTNFLEKYYNPANATSAPFLAALWFNNPHAPFIGSGLNRNIADSIVDDEIKTYGTLNCGLIFEKYSPLQNTRKICSQKYNSTYCNSICRLIKREYYATIISLDNAVGKALELLHRYNVKQNTFVIFSSDNGPARFDSSGNGARYIGPGSTSGLPGVKLQIREGGIRVPAIFHYPKLVSQNRIIRTRPVGNVDILPTVLDLMNEPDIIYPFLKDAPLDGVSLVPYFYGLESPRFSPLGFALDDGRNMLVFENVTLSNYLTGQIHYTKGNPESFAELETVIKTTMFTSGFDAFARTFRRWVLTVATLCRP